MLVRWQPFQEMEEVRRQFDRLFREFAPFRKPRKADGFLLVSCVMMATI